MYQKKKKKTITDTKLIKPIIETNKINKKQRKMDLRLMICYTLIQVLNVNILLLTLISSLAFNTEEFT